MTRLIITTIHRETPLHTVSGWIYVVDLESRKIIQTTEGIEPPNRVYDYNPRGGMRGLRGISICNGELAVAGYSAVFFFDRHWNLLRSFTHPSVSAIHEILFVNDGLWVTSTANDMLVKFDQTGKLDEFHYLRMHRSLMTQLDGPMLQTLKPSDIMDGKKDFRSLSYFIADLYDHVHLNGLDLSNDGQFFLSLGLIVGDAFTLLMNIKTFMRRIGVWALFISLNRVVMRALGLKKKMLSDLVVQPSQGKSAIVIWDRREQWQVLLKIPAYHNPSHSVRLLDDGTGLYLVTSKGLLIHFDKDGNILLETKITDKFLRGLLVLPGRQLVIGAGNSLIFFDFNAQKITAEIQLSNDPLNTVFDLQILPPEFELPPASLQAKIGRIVGYSGQEVIWKTDRQ
jgi:hypothetical protein